MQFSGITLVISPLISLIQDQVNSLIEKGIKALNLSGNIPYKNLQQLYDSAVNGEYKFIFCSPERIQSASFQERVPYLNVDFLVIDEAHCISQWGHDFRPSYRKLCVLQTFFPKAKTLALTATATKKVRADICTNLQMKNPIIHIGKFSRENLSLLVFEYGNKWNLIQRTLQKQSGTGIIYGKTRRETINIAQFLEQNNISSGAYHAGLPAETRKELQEQWLHNKKRVIAATNAFGMGVDKPDVRFVCHGDIPTSPEMYYQEAGRAGRDGKKAFALLAYQESEWQKIEQLFESLFPEKKRLIAAYNAVANFLKVPTGTGIGLRYDFDLISCASRFNFKNNELFTCLKALEWEGLLELNEGFKQSARLQFTCNQATLYTQVVGKNKLEKICKVIMRQYGGVFDVPTSINIKNIAFKCQMPENEIEQGLDFLVKQELCAYLPANETPQLTLLENRQNFPNNAFKLDKILVKKQVMQNQLAAVKNYLNTTICRQQWFSQYFEVEAIEACGICDNCLRLKPEFNGNKVEIEIIDILKQAPNGTTLEALLFSSTLLKLHLQKTQEVVQNLLDNGTLSQKGSTLRLV